MRRYKGMALAALLFAIAPLAVAQVVPGAITFAVEITSSSNGAVTPRATWSTNRAAKSCAASGDWSGTKPGSGTETLAPVTEAKNYVLTCTWGDDLVKVNWILPTVNTDETPLTNLKAVRIYYRLGSLTAEPATVDALLPGTTTQLGPLAAGKWWITATAITTNNVESGPTNPLNVDVGSATTSKSVALAVKIPKSPTGLTAVPVTQ